MDLETEQVLATLQKVTVIQDAESLIFERTKQIKDIRRKNQQQRREFELRRQQVSAKKNNQQTQATSITEEEQAQLKKYEDA